MKIYFEFVDNASMEQIHAGLPKRATQGSVGYDFFAPYEMEIGPGEVKIFETGIRVHMPQSMGLFLVPRSSIGLKRRLIIPNTIGVIDSDYVHAENGGNIIAALWNTGRERQVIHPGEKYMQGIFLETFITTDDNVMATRTGGLGSTDNA